jgi:SAM-dependent methyltransferase
VDAQPRSDLWKTEAVFHKLAGRGLLPHAGDASSLSEFVEIVAKRFLEALRRRGLTLHSDGLAEARPWDFFVTNLALYSAYRDSFVDATADELSHMASTFNLPPDEVFRLDWTCVTSRGHRFGERGHDSYYSHLEYMSHLWVENVAARRLFFVLGAQSFLKTRGFQPSGMQLIDVGCGMGGTVRLLDPRPFKLGVDISRSTIAFCEGTSRPGESFGLMDGTALAVRESSFDAAFSFDVVEHVDDPIGVLREMRRIVNPAGAVVVVYPFGAHDWDSHISMIDREGFEGWLREAGLEVAAQFAPPGESWPCSICYVTVPS